MSLRVVLGPAGARKTGRLLDAHQQAAAAGQEAWLVVPGGADLAPIRRELLGLDAPGGTPRQPTPYADLIGAPQLERRLLERCTSLRTLGQDQRKSLAEATVREALQASELDALAPAARRGWLAGELIGLVDELTMTGDLGGTAEATLEAWGGGAGGKRGRELATLLRADAARRAALASGRGGLVDRATAAHATISALAATPQLVDDLHLTLAGFDDLDPVQRALLLALGRSPATVLLSLPYQLGREALAAAGPLVDALIGGGADVELVEAQPLAVGVHPVLAELRAALYEATPAGATPPATDERGVVVTSPDEPAAPVIELRGGGPDEELVLIAETVGDALARGINPARIAVLTASPDRSAPAIVQALERAGITAHAATRRPAAATPIVRGVAALMRATPRTGKATDLVAYLALLDPDRADLLDASIRRRGARTAQEALGLWARLGGARVTELDELREAAPAPARGADAPAPGALERTIARILTERAVAWASTPGAALTAERQQAIRTAQEAARAVEQRALLAERAAGLAAPITMPAAIDDLERLLTELQLAPEPDPAGSIAVVGPLAVRTRPLDLLVVAHAQYGTFPAPESSRRLLSRSDRADLTDLGWPRPVAPDHAARERYVAYEIASAPEQQLAIGWHAGDGDGGAQEPSPLVVELRRTAGNALVVRELAAGRAGARGLRPERAAAMSAAADGPRHYEPAHAEAPAAATGPGEPHGVRALQTASRCTAQWFVDHHLQPRPLDPDAAPLTAGRLRHEVLADLLRELIAGGRPLGPDALPTLHTLLDGIAATRAEQATAQSETLAERLMRERIIAEVRATLPSLAGAAELHHQPSEFELAFGTTRAEPDADDESSADSDADPGPDARPPVIVRRAAEELTLTGRLDRLDVSPDHSESVVVDYKGSSVDQYAGAKWLENRELQAGLYALVAEELTGARSVGSLYQPVPAGETEAPRGATALPLPDRRMGEKARDAVGSEAWGELLDEVVRLAAEAARAIEAGVVAPCPTTCSAGGCRYPWLCREASA